MKKIAIKLLLMSVVISFSATQTVKANTRDILLWCGLGGGALTSALVYSSNDHRSAKGKALLAGTLLSGLVAAGARVYEREQNEGERRNNPVQSALSWRPETTGVASGLITLLVTALLT